MPNYFRKFIIICVLLGSIRGGVLVWAAKDSDNYQIWLDTLNAGGGKQQSANYQIDSNLSDTFGVQAQSSNFLAKSGFSGIEDEPTVGFLVQSVTLNFGKLLPTTTAYSSHTLSAYTNSKDGYTIKVYGQPLHNETHTIAAIGAVAQLSTPGTEQFGLNLVANDIPIVGADPSGGIGQAANHYNQTNHYAFLDGDDVAQASSFSYQTDFTISVIVNIAPETEAGLYGTTLTYEFIPIF